MLTLRLLQRAALLLCAAAGLVALPIHDASAQQGAMTIQLDLARMVDESQSIVLGRVAAVQAEPHPDFENLDTVVVTLDVLDTLKGSPGEQLTFRQYVADVRDLDAKLGYRVGEEVVLLLRQPSQYGLTSPVGLEQGRFRVARDAVNNRVVRNGYGNAALFEGMEQTAPALRPRLSANLQQLVTEHRSGPITYDQFKSLVGSILAARQAAQ